MTKAGGQETYFGRVGEVSYADARQAYSEHLKTLGNRRPGRAAVTCLEVCATGTSTASRSTEAGLSTGSASTFWSGGATSEVGQAQRRTPVAELPATKITREELHAWLESLKAAGADRRALGESSRRSAQTAVKACWSWASGDGGLLPPEFQPFARMAKIRLPMKELTEEDLITEVEIKCLFASADADWGKVRGKNGRYRRRTPDEYRTGSRNPYRGFQELLRCYYHTGARTSELAHIRIRHVLRKTKQVALGHHKRSNTQAEPTTHRITLNDEAFAILERHARGKSPEDHVFTQGNGSPWNKDRLDERFGKIRELARVRDETTIYSFRHLWISEALMAGNDAATVAKMAGTSIRMIEKVYGYFRADHFAEAQRRLDEDRSRRKAIDPQIGKASLVY